MTLSVSRPMSMPPRAEEPREHGWYRDLDDARLHRYWNGSEWFRQDQVFPGTAADGRVTRRSTKSWDWPLGDPST